MRCHRHFFFPGQTDRQTDRQTDSFFGSFWQNWKDLLLTIYFFLHINEHFFSPTLIKSKSNEIIKRTIFWGRFCEQIIFFHKKTTTPPPPDIKWPTPSIFYSCEANFSDAIALFVIGGQFSFMLSWLHINENNPTI